MPSLRAFTALERQTSVTVRDGEPMPALTPEPRSSHVRAASETSEAL